jgi:hypothetical protein
VAGGRYEMMPRRAIYSAATLLLLLGLFAGIAVKRAGSQGLTMRNELTPEPTTNHRDPVAPIAAPAQGIGLAAASKALAGKVWPPAASGRPNPLWSVPVASLTATHERPIFSPSRRPPPTVVAPAPQAERSVQLNHPLFDLVGTVADGAIGIAIFREQNSKAIVRLRTGESHSGWTLTAVMPRKAILQDNRDTVSLAIASPPAK